jgi:3-hydroxybutyryl-CoA dehydrogenase
MTISILAAEDQKAEWLQKGFPATIMVNWANSLQEMLHHRDADVFFDLLFEEHHDEVSREIIKSLQPKPVFINSVCYRLSELEDHGHHLTRINAWNGFINRPVTELVTREENKATIEPVFNMLGWSYKLLPDITGMFAPRVVSAIINEAYFTLGDNVSTKEEIDIAMKLGTNYPYGPFEWSKKIGLKNIYRLLQKLSEEDERYQPAALMTAESATT